MRITRIHHITIAVRELDRALDTFERLFGARVEAVDVLRAFGVEAGNVPFGDSVLQLASPTDADSAVGRFLTRRGEGVYNIAVEVDDLDAAIDELSSQGVRVSDPVEAQPGVRSAFVSSSATHGVSIQLMQVASVAPAPPAAEKAAPDETPTAPAPSRVVDLTPDEWSDVD